MWLGEGNRPEREHLFEGLTPLQLLETAHEVIALFGPNVRLHKNEVGNLAVLDAGRNYVGWIDLRFGGAYEVQWPGREEESS